MLKFLLFCGVVLVGSRASFAQATSQPFIKIAHLGKQGRPIIDLYLATQTPELNPTQGIDGRYRFESVCLLTENEFAPLLRYANGYESQNKSDSKDDKYGTFEITIGPDATHKAIYTRAKSLAFLSGAVQVLQKQAAQPDINEALHRLDVTTRRLSKGI